MHLVTVFAIVVLWAVLGMLCVQLADWHLPGEQPSVFSSRTRFLTFVLAPPITVAGLAFVVALLPLAIVIALVMHVTHTGSARYPTAS